MNFRVIYLLVLVIISGCSSPIKVDLILHNATIMSLNSNLEIFEAIAIKDGKIIEVGAENQILNKYTSIEKVDVKKQFIYPGFIDAHCHFVGYGLNKTHIELVGTTSFEDMISRIKSHLSNHTSEWVLGRGWDQNDWSNKSFPTNDTLNELFPDIKIVLKRIDGHAMLVTSNVLELAQIDSKTKVEGGTIRKMNGKPTGIITDEAMALVEKVVPKPTRKEIETALLAAQSDCFRVGLTTVTDAGLDVETINIINQLHHSNSLEIRMIAMYSASADVMRNLKDLRIVTDHLNATSVKVYCDGALGSRGAKLIEPYSDDTLNSGVTITDFDSLTKWAKSCYEFNFQLCVHSIGDAANRTTLKSMAGVLGGTNDRRWRIEHAQVVDPSDQALFGEFNILPSMQPAHTTSDMYWAEDRLGKNRISNAYAINTLKNQNGMIPLGTDFPVEDISPIRTFYAAVTRTDESGFPDGGFSPKEKLSREDALRGITIWPAIAGFNEDKTGSLEAGKFADLVILNRNILTCADREILSSEIIQTWINGKLVYEQ